MSLQQGLLAAVRRIPLKDLEFDVTIMSIWKPYVTVLRTDARFKQILRDLGLADLFMSSGNWGDFCKPVGQRDFECR